MQVSLHSAISDPDDGVFMLIATFDHAARLIWRFRSLLFNYNAILAKIDLLVN
jgi:hypothetical protein